MSRLSHLRVEIYNDVTGKPYVILEGADFEGVTASVPAVEVKLWADDVEIIDYRRKEG
jgi:hypothetical protein